MAAGDITAKRTNYSDFPCNVFDGVDDYVEIPHAPQQLGANLSNGFTISAWVNARSIGESKGQVFGNGTTGAGGNGFNIYMETTNRIKFNVKGTEHASGNNVVLYGQWYHILYTLSSANLCNLYINGVLTGAANQDLSAGGGIAGITTTNAPRIGNLTGATTLTFDGSIRSVKMWNRVLSTTEITEEYQGKNHIDGLIHHFKLGGDYADYGSVGVTATNSGSIANTTIPTKLQTNASQLNLAAVTDKIIALPVPVRNGQFVMIGANRAAA
jgi:hypothetical protein